MIQRMTRRALLAGALLVTVPGLAQDPEFKSGPQVGERPLPFTSNMVTGPERGTQHCYV